MTNKVAATFVRRRNYDNGNEAGGYTVCEFEDIVDSEDKKYQNKWFKDTKLLQAANLKKGVRYEFELSEQLSPRQDEFVNLPFPLRVKSEDRSVTFLKKGGAIFSEDENGNTINLSASQSIKLMLRSKRL